MNGKSGLNCRIIMPRKIKHNTLYQSSLPSHSSQILLPSPEPRTPSLCPSKSSPVVPQSSPLFTSVLFPAYLYFPVPVKSVLLLLHYNHTQRFSTMEYFLSALLPQPKPLKFGKSGSLSSVRTQPASHSKTDLIPRKISDQQKLRLINLITVQNYNMKEAAKIIQISYSTAKKIFTRFKKALRLKTQKREDNSQGRQRCCFKEIEGQAAVGERKVGVVSTVAGREQARSQSLILIVRSDC